MLKQAIGVGLGFGLAPRVFAQEAAAERPKVGDWLIKAGDAGATPLTPGDVGIGDPQTLAWAMDPVDRTVRNGSRLNLVLLLKLDAASLQAETSKNAADGVVAYMAICTHTGCEVEEWLPGERLLHCPCHSSKFDPADGARVVEGPAPRTLPALPLKVADGRLVVARPFTSRVGFEPA